MSLGRYLKKGLGFVGDAAKYALPFAAMIPGVNLGVGAAAGLGALAGGLGTMNDKKQGLGSYLKNAGFSGALSGAGAALSGAGRAGAVASTVASPAPAGAGMAAHGMALPRVASAIQPASATAAQGGNRLGSMLKQGANWLTDPQQGLQRTYMASQIAAPVLDSLAGPSEIERMEIEEYERKKRAREYMAPHLQQWMQNMPKSMRGF